MLCFPSRFTVVNPQWTSGTVLLLKRLSCADSSNACMVFSTRLKTLHWEEKWLICWIVGYWGPKRDLSIVSSRARLKTENGLQFLCCVIILVFTLVWGWPELSVAQQQWKRWVLPLFPTTTFQVCSDCMRWSNAFEMFQTHLLLHV